MGALNHNNSNIGQHFHVTSQVLDGSDGYAITPSTGSIQAVIDGGGATLTAGVKLFLKLPFSGAFTGWSLAGDQSGSVVIDVWKDVYANFPPTVADKITASAPPTISSAQVAQSSTLTGWTTTFSAGDWLAFNVTSATSITRVTLALDYRRTS